VTVAEQTSWSIARGIGRCSEVSKKSNPSIDLALFEQVVVDPQPISANLQWLRLLHPATRRATARHFVIAIQKQHYLTCKSTKQAQSQCSL